MLLNLPPEVRFNFCNIKLLAVVKSKDIRIAKNYLLFSEFINTLNHLNSKDGLEVKINNINSTIFGFLGFVIGDTLALQWLGGFVEGVGTAIRFCRTCHIHHNERIEHFNSKFVLRDINTHLFQLNLLKESPDLSKQFGLKTSSVLLRINDFDITKCLLHDPMHILIEGICINELKYLLNYLVKIKKIDLSIINKRFLDFDYFFIDKDDKPNVINDHHIANGSFPLSAGQMMTLMLNLPFILGDLINKFDDNWLNFINLNQIINIVFCYFYDDITIKQLDSKIFDYLQCFHDLYPNASITPKLHYLTHLPAQMDKFGPLRHHACFCCEAKNFLIKKFDYKSFKNICFSAADKHQFWMASKENEQSNKNSLKYVDDVCTVDKNKIVDSSI